MAFANDSMRIFSSSIRASSQHQPGAFIPAAIVTAVLPSAAAAVYLWLVPAGCDMRLEEATYRWTCLLPGLLIVVPAVVALLLSVANLLNDRYGCRLPDGWLVTALAVGLLTQVILSGAYLLALDHAYRGRMMAEIMFVPQPFVAGAIAGLIFWLTLHVGIRPGSPRPGPKDH